MQAKWAEIFLLEINIFFEILSTSNFELINIFKPIGNANRTCQFNYVEAFFFFLSSIWPLNINHRPS